jgi:hypothetical protein
VKAAERDATPSQPFVQVSAKTSRKGSQLPKLMSHVSGDQ